MRSGQLLAGAVAFVAAALAVHVVWGGHTPEDGPGPDGPKAGSPIVGPTEGGSTPPGSHPDLGGLPDALNEKTGMAAPAGWPQAPASQAPAPAAAQTGSGDSTHPDKPSTPVGTGPVVKLPAADKGGDGRVDSVAAQRPSAAAKSQRTKDNTSGSAAANRGNGGSSTGKPAGSESQGSDRSNKLEKSQ
jgi:hypothetical protein